MNYNDQNEIDFNHLRKMRNQAGEYMSKLQFDLAFEAILDIQRDIQVRGLHPSNFENILEEIIAIGIGLTGDNMVAVKFGAYLAKHRHQIQV
jgi:hypothetical protein